MGTVNNGLILFPSLLLTAAAAVAEVDVDTLSDAERIELSRATEVWDSEPPVVDSPEDSAPSDAILLLEGRELSAWESTGGGAAPWQFDNGVLTVKPSSGDIRTTETFCDIQLHMEWKTPTLVEGLEGQQRYNSGVFLQDRYEIQVLDSYRNRTYGNGQAGSLYKQVAPLVNASRPPGQWQVYDIIFTAPRFDGDQLESRGYVTVLHNGVLVQNHVEIQGTTEWIGPPRTEPHGCAPLRLQDHGNPVSFRNLWVRKL